MLSKALVICPSSLKQQWLSEVRKFTYLDGIVIDGDRKSRENIWSEAYNDDYQFVFVNYDLILNDYDNILQFCRFHEDELVIILDEAQKIKNWKTKTSTMIKGGKWKDKDGEVEYEKLPSKYRWLLSGTPMENRPDELYNLFHFLDPDILGHNYFVFRHNHIQLGRFNNTIGVKRATELHQKIAPYMLRRKIADVDQDFPEVRHSRIPLQMTPLQYELHDIIRENLYNILKSMDPEDSTEAILGRFSLLMTVANAPELLTKSESGYAKRLLKQLKPSKSKLTESPKLEWIMDFMESKLESDPESKTVIFTRSTKMQELIHDSLLKQFGNRCRVYLLNGSMNASDREQARIGFWEDGNVFISTDAGSTGVNLQCANSLINVDFPWNPATLHQRNGRIRRLGSKYDKVSIYNLVSIGSIDERIESVLYNKQSMFDQVIENTDEERQVIIKLGRNIMRKLVTKGRSK